MTATVGENRPLRDETNVAYRAFQAALRAYNAFITSYQPVTDPAATLAEIQRLERQVGTASAELQSIKQRNNRNPDLFDPAINQRVELAEPESITAQRGFEQARRAVNEAILAQEQEARTPTGPTASAEVTADQVNNPNTAPAQSVTADGEVVTPRATTAPSTAVAAATAADGDVDSGTDAPTRTLEQTQAPVNRPLGQGVQRDEDGNMIIEVTGVGDTGANDDIEGGAVGGIPGMPAGTAPVSPGIGANDDVADLGTVEVQAQRNAAQTDIITITPRDNVLDRFHNYTYNASVYVLSPEQFAAYQLQPKKTISGYNLLFQSGGAATGSGEFRGAAAGRADSGIKDNRNPAFPLDYYIDSIQIEHLILGRATQAAHGVTNIKFTVVEPGNISLLDNIYRAVQDLNPTLSGQINYAAAIYLMVIRFYGYDLDGRPVRVGAAAADAGQTDPDAVVEKFIP